MALGSHKLFQLLENFSPEELKDFRKFISSPVYSSGRNYLPLLDELLKARSKKDSTAVGIHNKIYPGKKYSSQTQKNRFSELFRLGEEFLIFRSLSEESIERDKALLRTLTERKLGKFFDNRFKKTIAKLDTEADDETKFKNIVDLQTINITNLIAENNFEKYFPAYYENTFYETCLTFINMFQAGIEFRQQSYLNRDYEFNIVVEMLQKINFKEVTEKAKNKDTIIYKLALMYYHLYKSFENIENEGDYFEARRIFNDLKIHLSDSLKLRVYLTCIYYSTHRQNMGLKKFKDELFRLYNEKLESGFYSDFSENIYPLNNFRDYVFIGIEVKQKEWVIDFINKYSKYLPDTVRDNEIGLSFSKVSFASGNFEDSLRQIEGIKPTNFLHYFDSSMLKLCNYYELDMIEEAYSEIDKFKHYIRSHNEIPKVHKNNSLNFTRFYPLLLKAKTNPDFDEVGALKSKLKSYPSILKRPWLNTKILELESRFTKPRLRHA